MDNQKPSTSKNLCRPSTSRGFFDEDEPRVKRERCDSFDGVELEDDSNLSLEFERMETDRRETNHCGDGDRRPNQRTSPNQRVPDRLQREQGEERGRDNPMTTSSIRVRHRSPSPSDPSSDSSSSEDDYIPYFNDPIREADRLRELRERRRSLRKNRRQRHPARRDQQDERERRREPRERSAENQNNHRPTANRETRRPSRERVEENREENHQPAVIQILIPYPEPAILHGMPPPHLYPAPGQMFPYMQRPVMGPRFNGQMPPYHGNAPIPPQFNGPMPPFNRHMPPFNRPMHQHFNRPMPPRYGAPPMPPPPGRLPPNRYRANNPKRR